MSNLSDELQEIDEQYKAATPGEWFRSSDGEQFPASIASHAPIVGDCVAQSPDEDMEESLAFWEANIAFVVALHNAWPRLLKLVGELKAELAEKNAHIAALDTALVETSFGARCVESRLTAELAAKDAETERLRGINPDVDVQEVWQKELPYLFKSWYAQFIRVQELTAELSEARAERDCYRAVLEAANYQHLDTLPSEGIEHCRKVGSAAAAITRGALAELARLKAEDEWTQNAPTEQGLYWHCFDDGSPFPLSILKHGAGDRKCFVSLGQAGLTRAVECDEYGGWWKSKPIALPPAPNQGEK